LFILEHIQVCFFTVAALCLITPRKPNTGADASLTLRTQKQQRETNADKEPPAT